jgi:AcrR family transcriptional regulator
MDVRDHLIQAALRVYGQAGSRGATTRRIAEAAGLNEVTLFRHFGSKDVLIRDALGWMAERALSVRLPKDPVDPRAELADFCAAQHQGMFQTRALIRKTMAEFEEHPEATAVAREITAGIEHELRRYLDCVRASGLAGGSWRTGTATAMLMGVLFADAVGRDCMPERYPTPPEQAVLDYVDFFLRAIDCPPGGPGAVHVQPK